MLNSMFNDFLMDDFFNMPTFTVREAKSNDQKIPADIVETKDAYEVSLSMPGVKKEDVEISLKDGYLKIAASSKQEEDSEGRRYVRRERFFGNMSRTFYVGDQVNEEDIKAKFSDGVLTVSVAKVDPKKKEAENKKLISIEG